MPPFEALTRRWAACKGRGCAEGGTRAFGVGRDRSGYQAAGKSGAACDPIFAGTTGFPAFAGMTTAKINYPGHRAGEQVLAARVD
jgi:hypothetical protein